VHGFGFAMALGDRLQFAGAHRVSALAAFNLGIEIGQLAVVLLAVPLLRWALHRVGECGETLRTAIAVATPPTWDALALLGLLRILLVAAVALALGLLLRHLLPRLRLT
jgi:hypothetical protein